MCFNFKRLLLLSSNSSFLIFWRYIHDVEAQSLRFLLVQISSKSYDKTKGYILFSESGHERKNISNHLLLEIITILSQVIFYLIESQTETTPMDSTLGDAEALQFMNESDDIIFHEIEEHIDNIDHNADLDRELFLNYILQTRQDRRSEELPEGEIGEGNCDLNLTLCTQSSCNEINLVQVAQGFLKLNMTDIIETVRNILFSLSCMGANQLMLSSTVSKRNRNVNVSDIKAQCSTAYVRQCQRLFAQSVYQVVGLSYETFDVTFWKLQSCLPEQFTKIIPTEGLMVFLEFNESSSKPF